LPLPSSMSKIDSSRESWNLGVEVPRLNVFDDRFCRWLQERLSADRIGLVSVNTPTGNGGSSSTYFVCVDIEAATRSRRTFVVRVKPDAFRVFMRDNFEAQFHLLVHLHSYSDVPVPKAYFYEPDPVVLGGPFYVMEKVEGRVPPDFPSYNAAGFLFDASVTQRHELWRSALAATAKIARVDIARMPTIVDLAPGESGLDETLRHWTESMTWVYRGSAPPFVERVNVWLWRNKPNTAQAGLSWGDARIGNMIFRDWTCAAVLDWESASLAGPVLDLAHWLLMDEFWSTHLGIQPLPGFGSRNETIALWEDLSGCTAHDLEWFEVLDAYRLALLWDRIKFLRGLAAAQAAGIADVNGDTVGMRQLRNVVERHIGPLRT